MKVPVTLDPQFREALAARLEYYRELGVYDLYRRGEPLPLEELVAPPVEPVSAATAVSEVEQPPVQVEREVPLPAPPPKIFIPEESEIPPRKPFPPAPPVAAAVAPA